MTLDLSRDGMFQLSREKYDEIKNRVNWSHLKNMGKSPAHYRYGISTPFEDTDPKQRGRAVACCTLEPELYPKKFVVWDGRRAGKEYEKFCEEHLSFGREIITAGMDEAARAISEAVRANEDAMKYLVAGTAEATLFWTINAPSMGGVEGYTFKAKGRPDFISMFPAMADLKSTKDASPGGFARQVLALGYHGQAAFYVDGYHLITGKELPFIFIAVEPTPPYPCTVLRMTEEWLQLGRNRYRTLLDRLALCNATNNWPEYVDGEVELPMPEWAVSNDDDEDDPTGMGLVFANG